MRFKKEMEPETILVASIELDVTETEITKGETLQLTATVLPEDATTKTVTWASSDESIATVDSIGMVTAVAPGTATITAMTNDGSDLSASCTVTVASPVVPVGDNFFVMADTAALHGDMIVIPVTLNNEDDVIAFQTDVFLPEGFEIVQEDGEYIIDPSERMTSSHIITSDLVNNGSVRVLCYSPDNEAFMGNSGDVLFYMTVAVPDDAVGDYTISLRNTRLTLVDFAEITAPDTSAVVTIMAFIPGDANDSRTVTVTDIVTTVQYILDRNPQPFILASADMNADEAITITDVALIANLIKYPTMMYAPLRLPILDLTGDCMGAEGIHLAAGETRTVSLLLDNALDYTAFQLDLTLPAGLTASNFQLTDRAGSHALDVNTLCNGKTRVLCYSAGLDAIEGNEGALLTFDLTANGSIDGNINVDGIEMVTTTCQTVLLDSFAIGVNDATSVNEMGLAKNVVSVDYFNVAGQRLERPGDGVNIVVTTYIDGTRTVTKLAN